MGFAPGKNVVGNAGIAMLAVIPRPLEISEGIYAALQLVLSRRQMESLATTFEGGQSEERVSDREAVLDRSQRLTEPQ